MTLHDRIIDAQVALILLFNAIEDEELATTTAIVVMTTLLSHSEPADRGAVAGALTQRAIALLEKAEK